MCYTCLVDIELEPIDSDEQAMNYLREHFKPGQLMMLARLYREGSDHGSAWVKFLVRDRRVEWLHLEKIYR